ncbi:MAG: hypothetical protein D6798_15430 [Deltaproteobacteria bacterium]|nr:MAG: hypothetical protein D6798_15430 [Deltaproteobacteria bacterium]
MKRRSLLINAISLLVVSSLGVAHGGRSVDAATARGRVVASTASGFTGPLDDKQLKAMLRGMITETPSGHAVSFALPPPHSESLEDVLAGLLGWSEATFERQRTLLEQRAGRSLYKRMSSDEDSLSLLATDPGFVAVVDASTPLPDGAVVIWGPARTEEAAP